MMLKIHSRTCSRLILAGMLAAICGFSIAQDMGGKPGTMAAAQAQSQTPAPAPQGASSAMPAPRAPGLRTPRTPRQRSGVPGAPVAPGAVAPAGGAAVPAQPEGRLRPRIILPDAGQTGIPGMSQLGGNPSMPTQMGMHQGPSMNMPQAMPPMPAAPTGPRDPFAPASTQSAAPVPMSMPAPVVSPAAKAAAAKAAKDAPTVPSINLACTTPDIKTQGVFVGKIQNRYVYKYKSQYCFDIEP